MKKQLFTILASVALFTQINAQQALTWVKNMGSTASDGGASIAVDASGNVYTAGYFAGVVDFNPGVGTFTLSSSGYDVFVQKLDATGNFLWAKSMGGAGNQFPVSMDLDASNNIYITGNFQGTANFDSSTPTFTALGVNDIFALKLDASGNFVWAKSFGDTNNDESKGITVDASGNSYITGYFQETVDFDPGVGTFSLTSAGSADIFVLKLDVTGNFVWAKNIGGAGMDIGNALDLDASGNIYTAGYFQGTVDFDPGVGTFSLTALGGFSACIVKLDASGNFVWANRTGNNPIYAIAVDGSGNVHSTGIFGGTIDLDPGVGTSNVTGSGIDNVFIQKLDATGNFIWGKSINATSGSRLRGQSIGVDGGGYVYTTGYLDGTADFDPSTFTFPLTSALTGTVSSNDGFISKLDASGNFVWAGSFGSTGNDGSSSIAVDASGNAHITGYFESTVDFNPNYGITNLTSNGSNDIFVLKLSPCVQPVKPVNTTSSALLTICAGNTTTLSVTSPGPSVSWYNIPTGGSSLGIGTPFTTPTLSTTSTLYAQTSNTCGASATREPITVTVNSVTAITSNTLLCVSETATLTLSGALSYTLLPGGTTGTSFTINPTTTTSYTINGIDVNGCSNTTAFTQSVSACTGVNETWNEKIVSIYPNPSNGLYHLELLNDAELIITNILGKVISTQKMNAGNQVIDIQNQANGVYFIKVSQNQQQQVIKLIKE